jgi:tetratricopeptide (TPR) repeat protein
MKQFDIAKAYFNQALPIFLTNNNSLFLYNTYHFLGELFDSTRHYDSALQYSRLALVTANKINSPLDLVGITKQLSSLFKKTGRLDSAFIYLGMAMSAKRQSYQPGKRKENTNTDL